MSLQSSTHKLRQYSVMQVLTLQTEPAASRQTTEAARLSVQQRVLGTNDCEHVCNAHRLQTLETKQSTPVDAAPSNCHLLQEHCGTTTWT